MEKRITFYCNNELIQTEENPALTMLDFLRSRMQLKGTKEGCREGDCGACTILVGRLSDKNEITYQIANSCLLPLGAVNGLHVVSVEGLNTSGLNLIQQSMVDEGGTQCGFCTPGFIISLTGFFINTKMPVLEDGIAAIAGNICRCTGYSGIKRAMENVIVHWNNREEDGLNHLQQLVKENMLPQYFESMSQKLNDLKNLSVSGEDTAGSGVNIGGGTDLFVQRWESLLESNTAFTADKIEHVGISETDDQIMLGGTATISDVLNSPIMQKLLPNIKTDLALFGSLPIRNRGTVAGNIVNASPIADMVNILLALDADLELNLNGMRRTVKLKDFYKGYKQLDKHSDELIEKIIINKPPTGFLFNYEKISRRTNLDIASVNSSMSITLKGELISDVHISAGGVAPIPKYLTAAREALLNKPVSTEALKTAVNAAMNEAAPISDARGSAEYKRMLLGQLIKAHFIKLFPGKLVIEEVI